MPLHLQFHVLKPPGSMLPHWPHLPCASLLVLLPRIDAAASHLVLLPPLL